MKEKQFKIDGVTYTVKATTEEGLKKAVRMMKKAHKKNNEDKGHGI